MTTVVLVHGIGSEQSGPDQLLHAWLLALADGVRLAGYHEIADRLSPLHYSPNPIEVCPAFYADCFRKPGRMGPDADALPPDQQQLAEQLAREWLERAATRSTDGLTQQQATRELRYLETLEQEQGPRAAVRTAIAGLAKLRFFGSAGMAFAERFANRSLAQVTRYFTEDAVREKSLHSVLSLVGPETRIIVGHSLGSIIAYEAAHLLKSRLPLLVTLGSPLGLRTVVYDRVCPQPPTYPHLVERWVNVADPNDIIAAEPDLGKFIIPLAGATLECYSVDNGKEPHDVKHYLGKEETGRPIGQTLS